jgi:hypothetical protein
MGGRDVAGLPVKHYNHEGIFPMDGFVYGTHQAFGSKARHGTNRNILEFGGM